MLAADDPPLPLSPMLLLLLVTTLRTGPNSWGWAQSQGPRRFT